MKITSHENFFNEYFHPQKTSAIRYTFPHSDTSHKLEMAGSKFQCVLLIEVN